MVIRYLYFISFIFLINISNAFKWNPFASDFNACDMTFMWRYPMYMDVGFEHDFKRYSLLLYGEGLYAQKFLRDKKVDGLPIIFVPGNAGSAKQARSIGSLLQNKTDLRNTPFHFDVFTLNFNEQFSGFSSSLLLKQADFLEACVKYISQIYEKPPAGIIFIGHSMGGMVIREVVKRPTFDLNQVSVILTFATPHLKPPIIVDSGMYKLWKDIENAWNETRITSSHIRVVSISSGLKDEMISETLTNSDNPTVYHYVTTGIGRVWVEADHQCIVWCNQLVRHTSRFIFYYAENMGFFRQNIDSIIQMFYSGVGRELKPILPKGEIADATVCPENEACFEKGIIGITKASGTIILVIEKSSNYQLITSSSCSLRNHYLSEKSFYNIVESDECNTGHLLINTNASKLWIANSSQIYLSPLTLQSSLFQHSEARRFTVSKGIRRLKIHFSQVTQTSVFVVSIVRKCTGGDFRAIFEIDGVQRFDEFLTKEKSQRIVRILSHSGNSGILTFLDTEKCSYDIKIEQDWKNTVKLALLEWVSILPGLIFGCLCFFVYAASKTENTFLIFLVMGTVAAAGSPLFFKNLPFVIFFTAFTVAFLIYQIGTRTNRFLSTRTALRRQPSIYWDIYFIIVCLSLSLFLHPFIGSLLASFITSFQNRAIPSLSSPFKLFYIILISIPGMIYIIEVIKHSGDIQYPWDCFTLASVFFIISSFFAFYHHYRVALLCFLTAIPIIWSLDFTSHIVAIDFQTSVAALIYAWSLKKI